MKSKDFIKQINIDKLTLNELYKLDRLNINKFSKFGNINLLSLVMVQMQIYLSSSIINKKTKPYNKFDYFPTATSRYLNLNTNFYEKTNEKIFRMNSHRFKKIIYSFVPFSNITTLDVFSDIYESISKELNKKFVIRKKNTFKPIYLSFIDEQIKILENYLKKFAKNNKIKNTNYSENFIKYIKPYFSYEKHKIDNSRFFFVGSNAILENRVTSANYLLNKRTVISFNHANYNTLIIDEPHQEYTEHAFCSYYVDCGSLKKNKKKLKSNFLAPKEIIYLDNPNYTQTLIKKNITKNEKNIFVPDAFNGDQRHGPYREMDDEKYLKFQSKLIGLKSNILIKNHPKNQIFSRLYGSQNFKLISKKSISGKLSSMVNKYPLFIVDRISQAFFEIAHGKSKILLFDIGRRRIYKKIMNEVKKRAYVVKIDPYNTTQKNLTYHINKALKFKIKKSKIMNLACYAKNQGYKKFFKILKV